MKLIGITGYAGVGKDTLADYLVERYNFTKRAFADPLYQEIAHAYGINEMLLRDRGTKEHEVPWLALGRQIDGDFTRIGVQKLDKECDEAEVSRYVYPTTLPLSPRWVLQTWGTEYRRGANPDYWVHKMDYFIKAFLKSLEPDDVSGGIVIPDVRFESEVELIRSKNGEIWHLHRPAAPSIPLSIHQSEQPLPIMKGDKVILNRSNINALCTAASLVLLGAEQIAT